MLVLKYGSRLVSVFQLRQRSPSLKSYTGWFYLLVSDHQTRFVVLQVVPVKVRLTSSKLHWFCCFISTDKKWDRGREANEQQFYYLLLIKTPVHWGPLRRTSCWTQRQTCGCDSRRVFKGSQKQKAKPPLTFLHQLLHQQPSATQPVPTHCEANERLVLCAKTDASWQQPPHSSVQTAVSWQEGLKGSTIRVHEALSTLRSEDSSTNTQSSQWFSVSLRGALNVHRTLSETGRESAGEPWPAPVHGDLTENTYR